MKNKNTKNIYTHWTILYNTFNLITFEVKKKTWRKKDQNTKEKKQQKTFTRCAREFVIIHIRVSVTKTRSVRLVYFFIISFDILCFVWFCFVVFFLFFIFGFAKLLLLLLLTYSFQWLFRLNWNQFRLIYFFMTWILCVRVLFSLVPFSSNFMYGVCCAIFSLEKCAIKIQFCVKSYNQPLYI